MKQPSITVYGSMACADTTRARKFLDEHQIPYEYKDVDETPEYGDFIAGLNGGKRVMPTIRVDNANYFNPPLSTLETAVVEAASERE